MAGFIKRDVEQRNEYVGLNQKIDREIFNRFKDYCKKRGYPMNVLLEVFMMQYANGKFHLDSEEINKWRNKSYEADALNTTIDKIVYGKFKTTCKGNGYFVKCVIMAFMEKLTSNQYVLEFVGLNSNEECFL